MNLNTTELEVLCTRHIGYFSSTVQVDVGVGVVCLSKSDFFVASV
jgi:hypothetical protein